MTFETYSPTTSAPDPRSNADLQMECEHLIAALRAETSRHVISMTQLWYRYEAARIEQQRRGYAAEETTRHLGVNSAPLGRMRFHG